MGAIGGKEGPSRGIFQTSSKKINKLNVEVKSNDLMSPSNHLSSNQAAEEGWRGGGPSSLNQTFFFPSQT